jgi:transketolase
VLSPPYPVVLKPYGHALVALAGRDSDVLCLSGDLTRQCEVDLFQERFPQRFVNGGMAEANLVGMAGALARAGFRPFVHTFGVFATRRCYDQVAMAVAYPNLPVRLVGFMPGISSPGGPSHQAIDDVALMRALPNMTVYDVVDATEVRAVVELMDREPGPVYLRLKRGETPAIFDQTHRLTGLGAERVLPGADVALVAAGMGLPIALSAAGVLGMAGVGASVVNVTRIKPLPGQVLLDLLSGARAVVTVENHSIVGGLGSAVAELLAEAASAAPLARVGVRDTFAEGAARPEYLFEKYGVSTSAVLAGAWAALRLPGPPPAPPAVSTDTSAGYAPV